ncbi:hypothetical protein M514_05113 [Trichuris suis]|nr:hypothetical protein M514_05113 [Trichuris suis]
MKKNAGTIIADNTFCSSFYTWLQKGSHVVVSNRGQQNDHEDQLRFRFKAHAGENNNEQYGSRYPSYYADVHFCAVDNFDGESLLPWSLLSSRIITRHLPPTCIRETMVSANPSTVIAAAVTLPRENIIPMLPPNSAPSVLEIIYGSETVAAIVIVLKCWIEFNRDLDTRLQQVVLTRVLGLPICKNDMYAQEKETLVRWDEFGKSAVSTQCPQMELGRIARDHHMGRQVLSHQCDLGRCVYD